MSMRETSTDYMRKWPGHMAPPDLKNGRFVEDEKLLMRCLANPDLVLKGQSFAEFGRLYNRVAAAYIKRLHKMKSMLPHED